MRTVAALGAVLPAGAFVRPCGAAIARTAAAGAMLMLGVACRGAVEAPDAARTSPPAAPEVQPATVANGETSGKSESPTAAQSLADAERSWSVRYRYPVTAGYTDFELGSGEALDSVTTLVVLPTAEFVRPIGEEWDLIPFIGLGAGWLINDDTGIAILTSGVRAEWSRRFHEDTVLRFLPRIRYDANLNHADGLLGDWGRTDVALELRHAFGNRRDAFRIEPGLYLQGLWFWDDIDYYVPGLTPGSVEEQLEFGISFGSFAPIEVLGYELPRVLIGIRVGGDLETLTLRFGDL